MKYIEDGDEIVFKVDGQATEFTSEDEQNDTNDEDQTCSDEEEGEFEDDEESSEIQFNSKNNNATVIGHSSSRSPQARNEEPCTLTSVARNMQNNRDHASVAPDSEEEMGMQRFVDYIRRQGPGYCGGI